VTDIEKEIDISEMRESLGTIMASFTYIYDPYAIIKEIDIIMSFESAMLKVKDKWRSEKWGPKGTTMPLPPSIRRDKDTGAHMKVTNMTKTVKNYKEMFDVMRGWWNSAVEAWNSQTGNWKDSIMICSQLREWLFGIALEEQLVALSSQMYTLQINQVPQQLPGDRMFDEGGQQPRR
jgi:hypothetical protein